MRGDVGARGAQLRNRALHVRHAGVVQEDHVGQTALVSFAEICGRNDVGSDRGVWREVLHIRDRPGQRNGAPLRITSAAHLKFLCHVQQPPSRNFKWKAALELTDLLVPIPFRSSRKWVPRRCTNFGKWALVANEPSDISILKPGKRTTINFFQKKEPHHYSLPAAAAQSADRFSEPHFGGVCAERITSPRRGGGAIGLDGLWLYWLEAGGVCSSSTLS